MGTMFCHLKGCSKCWGDLVFDEGDWKCWQCGRYYYTGQVTPNGNPQPTAYQDATPLEAGESPSIQHPDSGTQKAPSRRGTRRGYGARNARNINSVIRAQKTSDERWWARNREVIEYLDNRMSVREVAKLVGRGERQIRVVRERLADLRSAQQEERDQAV